MRRIEIEKVLQQQPIDEEITVMGWVRAFRSNRFIALYDGSSFNTLQVVVDFEQQPEALLKKNKLSCLYQSNWKIGSFPRCRAIS